MMDIPNTNGSTPLLPDTPPAQWKGDLSVDENFLIAYAQQYARIWSEHVCPPNRAEMLLIAKLAGKLDNA